MALAGPEHRIVAMNAAYRSFSGWSGVLGVPCREAFPEMKGQQLYELFDRCTRQVSRRRDRVADAVRPRSRRIRELYADFTVTPWRAADHTINGLLLWPRTSPTG